MSQNLFSSELSPKIIIMISNFNCQLLRLMSDIENPVFSPVSIFCAMLLVYLGADADTKYEIKKALNIDISDPQLIIDLALIAKLRPFEDQYRSSSVQIVNSNALIIKSGFEVEKLYIDIVEKVAQGQVITFHNTSQAITKSNDWVGEKTFNLIPSLLGKKDVNKSTILILLNVIYFRAKWDKPFNQINTYDSKFYGLKFTKNLNFMHQTNYFQYYEDQNMQYIRLPYTNTSYSFFIALPKNENQNLNDFNPMIDQDLKWEYTRVYLSLPHFEHRYRLDLVDLLKRMGIKQLFTNNANLNFISRQKKLTVDKIIHEAVVKVDEGGTKAAAATAVVVKEATAIRPRPVEKPIIMNINHTFYYSIIYNHNNQQLILFNGVFDG